MAKLADPDPIDGLAMARAGYPGAHYRANVAFWGIRVYKKVSAASII